MIESLIVGHLYSNEEIFKSLKLSNAGGIRLSLRDKAAPIRGLLNKSTKTPNCCAVRYGV